jgi:formylglycine-generating enzyme required for sulfatase activity
MGANPSINRGDQKPIENVSWNDLTAPDGFLSRINERILNDLPAATNLRFRLPSETEWEYAARGGPHWKNNFLYSGSNDIDSVAWYDRKWGDHTHDVAEKAPNQLGLFDMSGNVWEWCHDTHTPDITKIPTDGRPYTGDGDDRVLRGGCFHNWAQHCTVFKRYEIGKQFHDGCIGFRLVLSV